MGNHLSERGPLPHAVAVRSVIVIPAAVLLLALAGCSATAGAAPSPTVTSFTAAGTISAQGFSQTGSDGEACATLTGYSDIKAGAQVVITDASGKTVALGTLDEGTFVDEGNQCVFPFSIGDVPVGDKFYGVHVGNEARGVVQYSRAELQAGARVSIG